MIILQAAAIATALSVDAFAASFAYGSNQIKIPMRSIQTINLICSLITGFSLFAGNILQQFIPGWLTAGISFTILFILGVVKLVDSITKTIIRKYSHISKELRFSFLNFHFILNLYADPEKADVDSSKTLTPSESVSLAVALSLDGIAVGFGAALMGISPLAVFLASFITNMGALILGCFLGNKAARSIPFNLSWIGGVILLIMAFQKLM